MEDKLKDATEVCRNEVIKKQNELAEAILLRHRQNGNMYVESFKNQVLNLVNEIKLYKGLSEALKQEYEPPLLVEETTRKRSGKLSNVAEKAHR